MRFWGHCSSQYHKERLDRETWQQSSSIVRSWADIMFCRTCSFTLYRAQEKCGNMWKMALCSSSLNRDKKQNRPSPGPSAKLPSLKVLVRTFPFWLSTVRHSQTINSALRIQSLLKVSHVNLCVFINLTVKHLIFNRRLTSVYS